MADGNTFCASGATVPNGAKLIEAKEEARKVFSCVVNILFEWNVAPLVKGVQCDADTKPNTNTFLRRFFFFSEYVYVVGGMYKLADGSSSE